MASAPASRPLRMFAGPSRYIQGPGALDKVGTYLQPCNGTVAVVVDAAMFDALSGRVERSLTDAGVDAVVMACSGEVTAANIASLTERAHKVDPVLVVAVGGGKTLDTGKGVARELGLRIVTVPTIASNDGPTSRIIALYDDAHRLIATPQLIENPAAVIVDTELVSQSPPRFLRAGIGDAIAKRFEAAACRRGSGSTPNGTRPLELPGVIAEACYRILLDDGTAALRSVMCRETSSALERVVEAVVLMSGLAFENGGLSLAHSITRGLMAVDGARTQLHGMQVAYGLLVQLVHEGDLDTYREVGVFFTSVGLPRSFADLGVAASPALYVLVAEHTLRAPHMANCAPPPDRTSLVEAMSKVDAAEQ